MFRRRTVNTFLCLLATFLVGTVVVLSSVSYYLAIDYATYITEDDVNVVLNDTDHAIPERVPRIIHQTWKSETLPPKWANISQACREMMPDYDYMLWTDASAREFIARHYSWFLDTFDGYIYPIQRADVIRYFVLYHYGGVYMDLDMGCLRRMDPLLVHPVILPKTIPVGVSNDLMFAERRHPFMLQTIRSLMKFDYSWILNYPTVMFSTGPMFLSAQFGAYNTYNSPTPDQPSGEVRILPKSLYGKNVKPGEAPASFFSHYYGSSWHAEDAAIISFLGRWGESLMWIALIVLVIGLIRMGLAPRPKPRSLVRIGGYEVVLPRWTQRSGRRYLDLGWFALPASGIQSPISMSRTSTSDEEDVQLLPLYDHSRSASPCPSDISTGYEFPPLPSPKGSRFSRIWRAGNRVLEMVFGQEEEPPSPSRIRRKRPRSRGVLFFLPAFLAPSTSQVEPIQFTPPSPHARTSSFRPDSQSASFRAENQSFRAEKQSFRADQPFRAENQSFRGDSPSFRVNTYLSFRTDPHPSPFLAEKQRFPAEMAPVIAAFDRRPSSEGPSPGC